MAVTFFKPQYAKHLVYDRPFLYRPIALPMTGRRPTSPFWGRGDTNPSDCENNVPTPVRFSSHSNTCAVMMQMFQGMLTQFENMMQGMISAMMQVMGKRSSSPIQPPRTEQENASTDIHHQDTEVNTPPAVTSNSSNNTAANMHSDASSNPSGSVSKSINRMNPTNRHLSHGGPAAGGAHITSLGNTVSERIQNVVAAAKATYPDNPTMAKLAATQAVYEAGLLGHPSHLALEDNNLFGIKGRGDAGSVSRMTTECDASGHHYRTSQTFAKNSSLDASFAQHRHFLSTKRYANLWRATSLQDAATKVVQDEYCTDPAYASDLCKIYNRYLRRYFA